MPRACTVLDAPVFAHARPSLADLRLYEGEREVPYVATISESAAAMPDRAQVMNLGRRGSHIIFDLAMPQRAYTAIDLELGQANFLALARVTGLRTLADKNVTELGTFTLFDLSGQSLSRNTSLPLQESSFPFLHVDLAVRGLPGLAAPGVDPSIMKGASVPPSREAQTLYTVVAETGDLKQQGRRTVAGFDVPANVPVERVEVTLVPDHAANQPTNRSANFSRTVHVVATPLKDGVSDKAGDSPNLHDEVSGVISRVRMTTAGETIRTEQLGFNATLNTSGHAGTHVEVSVDNGDDKPVALRSIRLAMRERRLCFDNAGHETMRLMYGDEALELPMYDYARTFNASEPADVAKPGPEEKNPLYQARVTEPTPVTERHPELLWVGLLAVLGVLALIAFRSAKRLP